MNKTGNAVAVATLGQLCTGKLHMGRRARARCAAIARYHILDTPDEAGFDDIVRLATQICGTTLGALSFVTSDRQWFKARVGLAVRETPISDSFCAHAIRRAGIFVIPDAALDPRFVQNPLVTSAPFIRFYAGMPINDQNGTPIATLCVFDSNPRRDGISNAEHEALRVLALQIESQLALRRSLFARDAEIVRQKSAAREIAHVANHDPLTGLPNRILFHARCQEALAAAGENSCTSFAVMMIDVDHFKQINDSIGHDAGDAVLCRFARQLSRLVRKTDTVARLGGDEFGIIFTNIEHDDKLSALLESISARLRVPFRHRRRLIECRASIGVARFPQDADDIDGLLRCSDLALIAAKVTRDCGVIFAPEMAAEFEAQMKSVTFARQMLKERRIIPHYQPKVDLGSGEIVGFEALLRWRHDTGASAMPGVLAAAFKDRELAAAISTRMLDQIVADIARWQKARLDFGRIAINSCAADFCSNDFAERLLACLFAKSVPATAIEVEITEDVFLGRGSHHVVRALSLLSKHGVRIALDDFGTGYASLTHLKNFPVHALKIDRSFIAGVGINPDDSAIVRALVALGTSLGLETIAEGIETAQQASAVRGFGCHTAQGYLYGAACPAATVPDLIDGLHNRLAA